MLTEGSFTNNQPSWQSCVFNTNVLYDAVYQSGHKVQSYYRRDIPSEKFCRKIALLVRYIPVNLIHGTCGKFVDFKMSYFSALR